MAKATPEPADPRLLVAALGIDLDPAMLRQALTHRSYSYENGEVPHNERLEFLGDSVLGIIITEALYLGHPELPEGQLAKLRASVVNMRALAAIALTLGEHGLGEYLLLGRGEDATGGRAKPSILADTLEALLGVVYLQHGLLAASGVVHRLFGPTLDAVPSFGAALDWKTSLQELTASHGLGVPEYLVTADGPDHDKSFTAAAIVNSEVFAVRPGRSKKEAEQAAAEAAWVALDQKHNPPAS